jgi:hypothetical protein
MAMSEGATGAGLMHWTCGALSKAIGLLSVAACNGSVSGWLGGHDFAASGAEDIGSAIADVLVALPPDLKQTSEGTTGAGVELHASTWSEAAGLPAGAEGIDSTWSACSNGLAAKPTTVAGAADLLSMEAEKALGAPAAVAGAATCNCFDPDVPNAPASWENVMEALAGVAVVASSPAATTFSSSKYSSAEHVIPRVPVVAWR